MKTTTWKDDVVIRLNNEATKASDGSHARHVTLRYTKMSVAEKRDKQN